MEKNNKTELTHKTKKQEHKSSVKNVIIINEQKFGKLFNTEIKNGKKTNKIVLVYHFGHFG